MSKIKQFFAVIMALAMILTSNAPAFAAEQILQIKNIEIASQSDTVSVGNLEFDSKTVTNNITFGKEGDELNLNLNVKNISDEYYKITEIKDSLESDNLVATYDFSDENLAPNETTTIKLNLIYAHQVLNVEKVTLSDLQITIRLVKYTPDSDTEAPADEREPETIEQTINIENSPNTIDNILIYVAIFAVSIIAIIALATKSHKNKKFLIFAIVLSAALLPLSSYASENIDETITFSSIELTGEFENYEIGFNAGGENPIETREIQYGQPLGELPTAPEKDGYNFTGWQNADGETLTGDEIITSPIVVRAAYAPINYAITYELADGELAEENPATYNIESDSFTLNNPSLDHYNFAGWTSSDIATPSKSVTIEKGSFGALSFTANYTPKQYNITFNANGGSITEGEQTRSIAYKTTLGELPTPSNTDEYVFAGWFDTDVEEAATEITSDTVVYGEATYYAHWAPAGPKISALMAQQVNENLQINWERGALDSEDAYKNNGNGINSYLENGTEIMYYRGEIYDNNLIWANHCWKIVRTTSTGGTKIIYNGDPTEVEVDGQATYQCLDEGEDVLLPTEEEHNYLNFNNSEEGCESSGACTPAYVGYMYGNPMKIDSISISSTNTNEYYFSDSVTRDGNNYTLNTTTGHYVKGTWRNIRSSVGEKYPYFCSTRGKTCNNLQIAFAIYASSDYVIYNLRIGGYDNIDQAIEAMRGNEHDSLVKQKIDAWYEQNLIDYEDDLEDTPFCSERNFTSGMLSPSHSGSGTNTFATMKRVGSLYATGQPILECSSINDTFTVSPEKGNGALTHKIGLLTADETILAGQSYTYATSNNYLSNEPGFWTMSPSHIPSSAPYHFYVHKSGTGTHYIKHSNVKAEVGARPAVSLKSSIRIKSGSGLKTDPYIVE